MSWKDYEPGGKMATDNRKILYAAQLLAVFDRNDNLVDIFTNYDDMDEALIKRSPKFGETDKPLVEVMKIARVDANDTQVANLLLNKAKLSGSTGTEIILMNGSWYVKAMPKAWAHFIPEVSVVEKQ